MELKNYPVTKVEEYDAMSYRLDLLAEALANVQPSRSLPKTKELNRVTREVLQFIKRLV